MRRRMHPGTAVNPSSLSAVTAAVASIQWAPQQLSPLRVTRRVTITPSSGPSSRRGLSPRPHDRCGRLGVIRKNSVAGCTLEQRSPVLIVSRDSCRGLHPMGPTATVTAQGDAPRDHHPAVWPQQPPWSVIDPTTAPDALG